MSCTPGAGGQRGGKLLPGSFLRMRDFVRVDVSACLMGAFLLLTLPLNWLLSALAAAAFHELCHGAAILLLGGRIWGVSHRRGWSGDGDGTLEQRQRAGLRSGRPRQEACCWCLCFGCSHGWRSAHWCRGLSICCRCSPLDGGRALRCALARFCPKMGKSHCNLGRMGNNRDIGRSRAGGNSLLEAGDAAHDGG